MDFLDYARALMDLQAKFPGTTVTPAFMGSTLKVEIPVSTEVLDMWISAQRMFEPAE